MKKLKLLAIFAIVSVVLITGCKKDEYVATVGVCPLVISTSPANAATGVPLNQIITATFNEKMNPATITQASFTVKGAAPIAGTVSYSGIIATFTPTNLLTPNTTYTGTIKTSAKDPMGNALQEDYVWTFSTDASPTVISTSPANLATGVLLNKIITASFSVPMDPASITGLTYTIKQGTTAVAGTVAFNGITASFTPTSPLVANTIYTGTVTTGAKNLIGTPMAANYVWTFTTGVLPTVISTDPANNATGVALNKVVAATFSVPMDPLTITSSSFMLKQGTTPVSGTVSYTGSTASFTPTSALVPNTLYTGTITTGAKNVAGSALAADYVWSFTTAAPIAPTVILTDPLNNATGVAIDKTVTATFSVPMDPLSITSTTVTLKQGTATPVAGSVSYSGSTASFNPASDLLPGTIYTATVTTGAKNVAGTTLGTNYVWTFTTANPVVVPPTVILTDPLNNATGVAIDKTVTATFSVPMDPLSITSATVTLKQGTASPITGSVSYSGSTASFDPTVNLLPGTIYTAEVTTGAKNVAGTALVTNYVWTFTTASTVVIPPTVILTSPLNNATGVTLNKTVTATFSVPMDPLTITSTTYTLKQGSTTVAGAVSYSGTTASYNPTADLLPGTVYTATVTTGTKNVAGTALVSNHVWTFTTANAVVIAPTVISTDPASNAIGVALNKTVTATFSVPMNPSTISSSTFTLKHGTTTDAGLVTYSGSTASFNPNSDLLAGTTYTATVTNGAENVAGTPMDNDYIWTFTTAAAAPIGPGVVNLGTAGDFAALTKSGISTTGITTITGNIGVSPAAASAITGFGLIMDTDGTSSHTPIVTGKVYAADYAAPTPAKMTTAVSDMETAYTTANNLTTPAPVVDLYAGDISGRTLAAGLYKWGTGLLITNAGVTLSGGPNDTWVFQIAQDLTVNSSAIVHLTGGAQAKNIAWVVAGQAVLGTNVDFSGIILSKTLISLNTGAKVNGRLLAQTAVTLNASTVVQP